MARSLWTCWWPSSFLRDLLPLVLGDLLALLQRPAGSPCSGAVQWWGPLETCSLPPWPHTEVGPEGPACQPTPVPLAPHSSPGGLLLLPPAPPAPTSCSSCSSCSWPLLLLASEPWDRCMAAQGPAGGRCGGRAREEGQPEALAAGRGAIGGPAAGPRGPHSPSTATDPARGPGWGHGNRATTSTLHTGRRGWTGVTY